MKLYDKLELLALDGLIPYARNSRTHSDAQVAQIAASIREFGFTNPILVDEAGGIIAGHGRVMAATRLGLVHVPCIRLTGLTEAQRRAYVIADNRLALNADWDEAMLAIELQELADCNFDVELLGFDAREIDKIISQATATLEGESDPDEAPAPRAEAISTIGNIWICGKHRVMCGDSTLSSEMARLMGGRMADILITDPPYNVAYTGKTKDALTIENDAMCDASFRQFLSSAFVSADAVMKPGAVFYIWHADSEGFNFRSAVQAVGWQIRQCLVWVKQTMVMGRQDYHWKHEPCLYGWKDGAAHLWASDRKQTTVLEFDRPFRNADHPTMKPIDLIEYQLRNNSEAGHIVLDSFGGSGTTLIAAEKSGRFSRLMEVDPAYVDVIVRRWQQFTGKRATLDSTGEVFPG